MTNAISGFFNILTLIIIVAIIAVILSKNAATSDVIQSFSSGLGNLLKIVVSPITSGN